jgi:signal transduction histidine kinase
MPTLLEELGRYTDLARRSEDLRAGQDRFTRREVDKLLELAHDLNACSTEDEAIHLLLKEAIKLVDADRGFLAEGKGASFRITRGIDRDGHTIHRPDDAVSSSILQQVMLSGQPLRSSNLQEMEELAFSRSVIDLNLKSSLCVPMRRKGHVIGAICVDSSSTRIFTEHMLVLLDGLCELASMTMAQLHLRKLEEARRERLHEMERMHRLITDAIPSGLILLDAKGELLFGNSRFEHDMARLDAFHLSTESTLGLKMREDLALRLREVVSQPGGSVEENYGSRSLRFWPFRMDHAGSRGQLGCVIVDVTIEKQLQLELLEREKFSMMSRMAGSIAHEIRNALSPLVGHSEMARLRILEAGLVQPELEKDMERINEMAERIARISENLRDLSRPLAHRPEEVDINRLIRDTMELMAESGGRMQRFTLLERGDGLQPPEHGLVVQLDLDKHIRPAKGDSELLQQALMNLVLNAAHALEGQAGGRIHCRSKQRDGHLEIMIEDNGCGMAPEVVERIFEPYFTTKGKGGTGMGMPLIRMVMDSHGGSVDVESSPGKGSRFTLRLPFC